MPHGIPVCTQVLLRCKWELDLSTKSIQGSRGVALNGMAPVYIGLTGNLDISFSLDNTSSHVQSRWLCLSLCMPYGHTCSSKKEEQAMQSTLESKVVETEYSSTKARGYARYTLCWFTRIKNTIQKTQTLYHISIEKIYKSSLNDSKCIIRIQSLPLEDLTPAASWVIGSRPVRPAEQPSAETQCKGVRRMLVFMQIGCMVRQSTHT
ncbi:hypothetical protein VTO42DRAFT_3652 [Malbranchea cinnamomea]